MVDLKLIGLIVFSVIFCFDALALDVPGGPGLLVIGGCAGGGGYGECGGQITLSVATTIVLHTSISANRSAFFRADGTTRGIYSVTAGKTFIVDAVCDSQRTSATGTTSTNQLLYADNSMGGIDSATAATNPVGVISGVATGNAADFYMTSANSGLSCRPLGGSVPASKFPYIQQTNTTSLVTIYGHEI